VPCWSNHLAKPILGALVAQKVLVVPFAENLTLTTSGGGTSYEFFELGHLDHLRFLGPRLLSITAHVKTSARTANARWKVVFYWSVDGDSWSASNDLFTEIAAVGQTIQTPFTDTTKFDLHMRYAIGARASTGTASESVTVGGALALEFRL